MGGKAVGVKVTGAQNSQEMGGKGDVLVGKMEMDNILSGDTTTGLNVTEGIRHRSYSDVVIEG